MSKAGVVLRGLTRRFGAFAAVDGIDLDVAPGELVTLLGPSGCGKTTTLRMVAGLERATSGSIAIGSTVVSDPARSIFVQPERRALGMVFQSYAIWPHMSVFDNVAYPLQIRREPATRIREQVARALGMVEMADKADRAATDLSGGQQQRVAIARALVFEPDVLLMDEPMSNLDARLRTQMGDEFRALQRRLGMTTIYVTHDQSEAMALSDRVVVMDRGAILQVGVPEDVYHRPNSERVAAFFGTPNIIGAQVVACRPAPDGTFDLDLAEAGWTGGCVSRTAAMPGSRVKVMIRAEDMTPLDPGREAGMTWTGEVVASTFRGPLRSLAIACGDLVIAVDAPSHTRVAVGDRITVAAHRHAAWALPT